MASLIFPALFPLAAAFFWSASPSNPHPVLSDLTSDSRHSLNQDHFDAIFLNPSTLESHPRKPECFSRAAGYMRAQCSELEFDEDQRIRVAISMTLCELATAKHHSPPMECRPFLHDFSDPKKPTHECVEALSRSAQFWSSYSGYLREAIQLCFAFQRWHDVDTAKVIYHNVTLEKAALLQLMIDREKRSSENNQQMGSFLEVMGDILIHLRDSSDNVDVTAAKAIILLQDHIQRTTDELIGLISNIYKINEEDRSASALQVQSRVDSVFTLHEHLLTTVVDSFGTALLHHLDDAFHAFRERDQVITDLANVVNDARIAISADVASVHESITRVSAEADHIADILHIQSDLAIATQDIHLATVRSAENLMHTVIEFGITARSELESISDIAVTTRETLIGQTTLSYWLSRPVLLNIVNAALKVDLSHFHHLFRYPVFRVIVTILRLLGGVLYVILSAILSSLLFSSRTWFSADRTSQPRKDTSLSTELYTPSRTASCHSHPSIQHVSRTRSRMRISKIPDRLLRQPVDCM